MILFVTLFSAAAAFPTDPFALEFEKSIPDAYETPVVSPEKEFEIENIAKKLSLEKNWPFIDKEINFEQAGVGKELEFEKELGLGELTGFGFGFGPGPGAEKAIGFEKYLPWATLYDKYFASGAKKLSFEQALFFEMYKQYGYYGLWVLRELQRRFLIAKELGLVGKEIALQEAITLGLFKGIGLEKIFEAVNKAIGVEKKFEFENGFGIFKRF